MTRRRGPVQPEERARVEGLIRDGVPRNEIARQTGLGAATVSRIADSAGLTFDRSATAEATRARVLDLADARTRLIAGAVRNAEEALQSVWGAVLVYNIGGKDNTYTEHELASAPVTMRKEVQTIVGIAIDKVTKALEATPVGTGEAESVLDRIEAGIDAEFTDVDDAEFGVKQ